MGDFDRAKYLSIARGTAQSVALLIGVTTMAAWFAHVSGWLQWTSVSPPMHFNSAFMLVLLAALLSPAIQKRSQLFTLFSCLIIAISSLTLAEYYFHINLHIDELFVPDHLTPSALAPGRISPNSCACALFLCIALGLRNYTEASRTRSILLETLGSIIFALSITAILGYASGISAAYAWGNLTHMPLQSAIAFAFLGKETTLHGWLTDPKLKGYERVAFATPVALTVLTFTVALSQALVSESRSTNGKAVEALARQLTESLIDRAQQTIRTVEDLSQEGLLSKHSARTHEMLHEQHPGVISISAYSGKKLEILYTNPDHLHSASAHLALLKPIVERSALSTELFRSYSEMFQDQGSWSLLYLFRTTPGAEYRYVALELDLEAFVGEVVQNIFPSDFYARVSLDGEILFDGSTTALDRDIWKNGEEVDWALRQEVPLLLFSNSGTLIAAPSRHWSRENASSYLPLVTLIAGVLFAFLISLLGHLALAAHMKQNELEFTNVRLKSEIARREKIEAELREAKQVADHANASKSFFLANISHELRTPLGVVIGFAELLKSRAWSADEARHLVDRILTNSSELTRIIDDLLDLTKAETGHLLIEEMDFNLRAFLEDIEGSLQIKAGAKAIKLQFSEENMLPVYIRTDRSRLRQILVNVIGNAIKFTEYGAVTVRIGCRPMQSVTGKQEQLFFRVQDSGIGLSADQKTKLFRAFGQADNSISSRFGGTGLGLSLSRQLARLLKGDVLLTETAPGVGSVFTISVEVTRVDAEIPLTMVANADASQSLLPSNVSKIPTPSLKGIRVLAVEDAQDNRFLLQKVLQGMGATVSLASDGEEALQVYKDTSFDIILMDLQMPIINGYQATEQLRQKGCDVPIIALTAHAMREERERCLMNGFNAYLTKPIHFVRLAETILTLEKQRSMS